MKKLLICVLFGLATAGAALAHPGGHGPPGRTASSRTWTFAQSGAHLHGSFVSVRDGGVQIRKDEGGLATLPLAELTLADQRFVAARQAAIVQVNQQALLVRPSSKPTPAVQLVAQPAAPAIAKHFQPFEQTVRLRWDERYLFVESNGIPAHPLMVGIRAWQQQVPLPQKYVGDNAWRIPLHPVPAKEPRTAKGEFLRGAIALAINGVPIFNPLNNRGEDAYLIGELDEYGGHCGRADDYHYHLPPVHLEQAAGKGAPIAYALDGYPIYGYQDPQAADYAPLDWLNGHKDAQGAYHYHATKKYPYLNGGFYGEVVERDGQVDPQPRAEPLRPALPALRGAKITAFRETAPGSQQLTYEIDGKPGTVSYTRAADGKVRFTFVEPSGRTTTEEYAPRPGGGGGAGGGGKRPPPRRPEDSPDPQRPQPPPGKRPAGEGGKGPPPGGKGPPPGAGGPRKPWIAEHLAELDANQDGAVARAEMQAEAQRTFTAYDANRDRTLARSEYDRGGVQSAFAGFVRGHAAEVDANRDGDLSEQEVIGFALQLFDKADRNRDQKTDADEAAVAGPGPRPGESKPDAARPAARQENR